MLSERELALREDKRTQWKRDISGRPNGTLDPFYGCFLWEEMTDYAANFTFPWSKTFTIHSIALLAHGCLVAQGAFDVSMSVLNVAFSN